MIKSISQQGNYYCELADFEKLVRSSNEKEVAVYNEFGDGIITLFGSSLRIWTEKRLQKFGPHAKVCYNCVCGSKRYFVEGEIKQFESFEKIKKEYLTD